MTEGEVSRRNYVKYAGAGVVVVAVAAAGGYYATRPGPPATTTTTSMEKSGSVRFLTWEDYGSDWIVKKCMEQTGIEVQPTFMSDNDEGFAKAMAAPDAYDCYCFDNPYVNRLKKAGITQPFDETRIDLNRFFPEFQHPFYTYIDGQTWGITNFWGPQALGYDTSKVAAEDVDSWGVMYDDPYRGKANPYKGYMSQMNSPLEAISTTALYLGLGHKSIDRDVDPFVLDNEQMNKVKAALIKQKPLLRMYWEGTADLVKAFSEGEVYIGNVYGLQVAKLLEAGIPAKFVAPNEGATYWVDTYTINKNPLDLDATYNFLNWITGPEIQAEMSADTYGASTCKEAGNYMSTDLKAITGYDIGPAKFIVWKEVENYSDWISLFDEVMAA
jgi:spermidine/putrescine transport system substrate-binding protein